MKWSAKLTDKRSFVPFSLSITVCIVFTLLLSSFIYYWNYFSIALKQAYQTDVNHLNETSKKVVSMSDMAQSLSFQIYKNTTITKLLYYAEPSIYDKLAAKQELSNYISSMPFIESIYIYNAKSPDIYVASKDSEEGPLSREAMEDQDIFGVLEHFQEYKAFKPILRTYAITKPPLPTSPKKSVYTLLCYEALGFDKTIENAVIINISPSWIHQEFGSFETVNGGGESYILDDLGRLLSGRSYEEEQDNPILSLVQAHQNDKESGYLIERVNGVKSLITYTSPDTLGWQYIRVIPYGQIAENMSTIRNNTFWIALCILLFGFFVAFLLSKFLYKPVQQIVKKMNSLESEKRNNLFTLKQNLLRNVIRGSQPLYTKTHLDKLEEAGITFRFDQSYRLILLRIDQFRTFKELRGRDLQIYKYAVMNISSEICSPVYATETVDLEDDSVLLMLSEKNPLTPASQEDLQTVCRQIQSAVKEHLHISLTVTYSPARNEAVSLPDLYTQVREASNHRFFAGRGAILSSREIMLEAPQDYEFPVDSERKLTECLMSGKTDEAKELFAEILEGTSRYSFQAAQLAVSNLQVSVNKVFSAVQKYHASCPDRAHDLDLPPAGLMETLEELKAVYYTTFDELRDRLTEKKGVKQEDMIRSINELIMSHYDNPDLSLQWIAAQLDKSPVYVGRVYKQHTLTAVIDVIHNVRLQKARELLEQTEQPISEIAEKLGYTSSSYFYRIFKKSFGVTPADYRKKNEKPSKAE